MPASKTLATASNKRTGFRLSALFFALLLTFAAGPAIASEEPPEALASAAAALSKPSDFRENDNGELRIDPRGSFLFLEGTINETTLEEITQALDSHPAADTLVLTSVPGSMDDEANLAAGRMIRARGLTTLLPAGGMVASGGTDLFLSGKRRILVTDKRSPERPRIGIHSWAVLSDGFFGALLGEEIAGKDLPRDDESHQLYLSYYRSLGIPEDFYWYTLEAAPADAIHWMTREEIDRFGIATDIVSAQDIQ